MHHLAAAVTPLILALADPAAVQMRRSGLLALVLTLAAGCGTPLDPLPSPTPTDPETIGLNDGLVHVRTDPPTLPFAVVTSYHEVGSTEFATGTRAEAGTVVDITDIVMGVLYEVRINDMPCGVVHMVPQQTTEITLAVTETSCAIRR